MNNPILIKSLTAEADIAAFRIVKPGANDGGAIQGAASTDALIGVANQLGAVSGGRVEVVVSGIFEVQYGGAVTRGDLLTSDVDGKAISAAPGAGVNARVIGVAMVSGVADDIGSLLISPGRIQG